MLIWIIEWSFANLRILIKVLFIQNINLIRSVPKFILDKNISLLYWRGGRFRTKGNLCQNIEIFPPERVHPCYYFRSDILTRRTTKLPLQSQQARRSYEQSQPSPFTTPVLPQKNVPLPLALSSSSPLPQQEERIYAQPILSQVCSMLHVFSFIGSYCRYLNIKLVMLEE